MIKRIHQLTEEEGDSKIPNMRQILISNTIIPELKSTKATSTYLQQVVSLCGNVELKNPSMSVEIMSRLPIDLSYKSL